ncbi:hypothetical protein DYU11_20275 [Fibrisoma montanum]|uniref:Uncharacterized protein n=1 Tax=Fibrisoma montanum TaxID=2305895 RepID=A0A418M3R9_9BACT|nr:hypothetical protein [Fibrisoma montanum]RIV20390.1 hypothetical protein DYU11_20275 [Fibrisoma montanum]
MENLKIERRQRLIDWINEHEEKNGYRRVAEKAGLSSMGLYHVVTGKNFVTLDLMDAIRSAYGDEFPYSYIMDGTREPKRESTTKAVEPIPIAIEATEFNIKDHPEYLKVKAEADRYKALFELERMIRERSEQEAVELRQENRESTQLLRQIAAKQLSFRKSDSRVTAQQMDSEFWGFIHYYASNFLAMDQPSRIDALKATFQTANASA